MDSHGDALARFQRLRQAVWLLGYETVELDAVLAPSFAVVFEADRFAVCTVPPSTTQIVRMSTGVYESCRLSPELYVAVNAANRRLEVGRVMVLAPTETPDRSPVMFQMGGFFDLRLVRESDQLRSCLHWTAEAGAEVRELLRAQDVHGESPDGHSKRELQKVALLAVAP